MKLYVICLFLFLIYARAAQVEEEVDVEVNTSVYSIQGLNVWCDTKEKYEFCQELAYEDGIDILKLTGNYSIPAEILVPSYQLSSFKSSLTAKEIKHKVVVENMGKSIEEELSDLTNRRSRRSETPNVLGTYPRYNEIVNYLKNLAESHSNFVTYLSIGKSFENRDIPAIKLSSGKSDMPIVVIDAGIHAREWIAPTTALYAIRELVLNQNNKQYFENVDIYIIPLLNPDGYEYSHQGVDTRNWRKTRSTRENSACVGVDGNRNFQFQWLLIGASSNPCSPIYAGPTFFSEPETSALRDFMLARKNIKVYLSLHSYGNFFMYPWGYTFRKPNNENVHKCTAEKAVEALSKVRQTSYKIGSSSLIVYPSAGSSQDWAVAKGGAKLAFTVELPSYAFKFAPPLSEIEPIGKETLEAIKVVATYADGKICTN